MCGGVRTHLSILLHALPPMLRDIVAAAAAGDPHVKLQDSASLRAGDDAAARFDVILSVCPDPNHRLTAAGLLARWVASGVVLITPSGRHAVMYELSATPFFAGDVSAGELVGAIRQRFTRDETPPRTSRQAEGSGAT
jgi:hypothetical protein